MTKIFFSKCTKRLQKSRFKNVSEHARSLTKEKRFKEAISVLGVVSKLCKDLPMEEVKDLVDNLVNNYEDQATLVSCYTDPWSCVFCSCVLEEPVTLTCGHSCCKKCLMRNISSLCKKCKSKYEPPEEDPIDIEPYIKVNILVGELVKKYWSRELESIKLRVEGNRLYQRDCLSDSIIKYTEAISIDSEDHLNLGNRSMAYYRNNQFSEALEDANKSIQLKPDWSKSYFRKGQALAALHRYEEAIVVFFQCYVLEETCSKALRMEMVRTMYKLITSKGAETEDVLPLPTIKALVKFASHPNLSKKTNDNSDGESENSGSVNNVEHALQETSLRHKKFFEAKNKRLKSVLEKIEEGVKAIVEADQAKPERDIDPAAVDKDDFDCAICCR